MKNVQCGKRTLAVSVTSILFILGVTVAVWNHQNKDNFPQFALNTQHARLSSRNLAHISSQDASFNAYRRAGQAGGIRTENVNLILRRGEEKKAGQTDLRASIKQRLPNAVIIGAAKCGTEALKKFLSLHPQVVSVKKELCFFNNATFYEKGPAWYRTQMPYSAADQITLEKSPSYFASRMAASRVRELLPDVKLIVAVCDPVRRSLSDAHRIYATKLHRRFTSEDFELEVINRKTGQVNERSKFVQRSVYVLHLRKWLHFFNLSRIHIVDGEMLAKDPLTELKKMEHYLGLPSFLSSEQLYYDREKGFYCMMRGRQKRCLPKNKGRKHPDISPNVFRALKSYFQPRNEQLFDVVGHRFRWS